MRLQQCKITYQWVAVITHEYECIDRRRMVCDANTIHRTIFWIVIVNNSWNRIWQEVEAMVKRKPDEPSLEVAARYTTDYSCTECEPIDLRWIIWDTQGRRGRRSKWKKHLIMRQMVGTTAKHFSKLLFPFNHEQRRQSISLQTACRLSRVTRFV